MRFGCMYIALLYELAASGGQSGENSKKTKLLATDYLIQYKVNFLLTLYFQIKLLLLYLQF